MLGVIEQQLSKQYTKATWKRLAKLNILCYNQMANEQLLENFLVAKYHKSLKECCLLILSKCIVQDDGDDLILTILDKKYERLARLITFGNGIFFGSNILKNSFMLKGE